MSFTGELRQLLDDHGPCRHVDPQRQGLGGEHHRNQPLGKTGFHRFLERRHHSGVVGGHTGVQRRPPSIMAKSGEVSVTEASQVMVGNGVDASPMLRAGEAKPGVHTGPYGVVTPCPAENEVDRRQHV